jgi:hypothetical protein
VVALDEIDLYTDVLSAVAAADRPLTDAELDEVLGIIGQSLFCAYSAAGWRYMASVRQGANPSFRYMPIAAVLSSST